jgi:hypothetical protein
MTRSQERASTKADHYAERRGWVLTERAEPRALWMSQSSERMDPSLPIYSSVQYFRDPASTEKRITAAAFFCDDRYDLDTVRRFAARHGLTFEEISRADNWKAPLAGGLIVRRRAS